MSRLFKVLASVLVIAFLALASSLESQTRVRTPVRIPDIPGYFTLKSDLHTHTVFSDGSVWPHIRAEEAWREGLDAIAITDHLEYLPHEEDLPSNHDRSFEIASPHGQALNLLVIRGSEVTRQMPPGHINAVFLESASRVKQDNWRDAIQNAHSQGAFIFWNHPGWTGQQPDGVARWYPEHSELVEQGMLHGIEVANAREYYPEAHRWCLEKGLTMLSNSDIHNPLNLDYHVHEGDHRPLTLVFSTERTTAAIKEALFARRTAVYTGNILIGERQFLAPLFHESIDLLSSSTRIEGTGTGYIQIHNQSEIDFELVGDLSFEEIQAPKKLVLKAGRTSLLPLKGTSRDRQGSQDFQLNYTVSNLKVTPENGLPVELTVSIEFVPAGQQ